MNAYTAVAIVNAMIVLAIVVISVTGFVLAGTAAGVWSILLAFFMMSTGASK